MTKVRPREGVLTSHYELLEMLEKIGIDGTKKFLTSPFCVLDFKSADFQTIETTFVCIRSFGSDPLRYLFMKRISFNKLITPFTKVYYVN